VLQRLLFDDRERQRQVAVQHVPALRADGRAAQRRAGLREPLARRVEQGVESVAQSAWMLFAFTTAPHIW
jgi:hypothetical protein